jgi:hypothetical protein
MIKIFLFCIIAIAINAKAETVAPITAANLKGQAKLFNEGWFVIASPKVAWEFAKENHESSQEAYTKALEKIHTSDTPTKVRLDAALKTMREMQSSADKSSLALNKQGKTISHKLSVYSSEKFRAAWESINLGYIHYAKTNEDDLNEIRKINQNFLKNIRADFKDMKDVMDPTLKELEKGTDINWKKHFKKGNYQFNQQYEKSGTRGNSITGLWDILVGYASWTYSAVVKPSSKAVESGTKKAAYYSVDTVLKTFIASHNIVYSLGSNLYYSTKLGFKVFSPSLESGFLSSLALLSAVGSKASEVSFKSVGLINKVAVKSLAPVAGSGQFVFEESYHQASNAITYLVHGSEATGEVVMEKVESGIALSYSALSQIPAQILLSALNSTIFLVYEGPKILLVKATGNLGDKPLSDLPTGSVLDMKKLKESGGQVETLSEDPALIKKVLENVKE